MSLEQDFKKLKKLDKQIKKNITEGNFDTIKETLVEFMVLKEEIKKELMEHSTYKIKDRLLLPTIKKVQQNELFLADTILKNKDNPEKKFEYDMLEDYEIDELQDVLYVWFGPDQYIRSLYEIGTLIVSISIPVFLKIYVSEARQCYAFQQYNAVYGLCRTILETAVRHTCERKGLIGKGHRSKPKYGTLVKKFNIGLKDKLQKNYKDMSEMLHGGKTISCGEARAMFKKTLETVEEVYSSI